MGMGSMNELHDFYESLPVQHQMALAALMGQSDVSAIVYFLTGSYNTQQTTRIVDPIRGYARNIFI